MKRTNFKPNFEPFVRQSGHERPFVTNYHFRQFVDPVTGKVKKVVSWNLSLRVGLLYKITDFALLAKSSPAYCLGSRNSNDLLKLEIRDRITAWRKLREFYPVNWEVL